MKYTIILLLFSCALWGQDTLQAMALKNLINNTDYFELALIKTAKKERLNCHFRYLYKGSKAAIGTEVLKKLNKDSISVIKLKNSTIEDSVWFKQFEKLDNEKGFKEHELVINVFPFTSLNEFKYVIISLRQKGSSEFSRLIQKFNLKNELVSYYCENGII